MSNWTRQIRVTSEGDVTRAIVETSETARSLGFDMTSVKKISTATSELARNVIKYAGTGRVRLRPVRRRQQPGMEAIIEDRGPGIPDLEIAMQEHVSTGGTLGLGLPGARRLVDEFVIQSEPGQGTRVKVTKWG